MEDEELYGLDFTGGLLYTTDESIVESKDCVDEIVELRNELDELSKESEHDYFMRLIVDEEVELTEARELVKERRQKIDELNTLITNKQEEHKQQIREYYISIDRANDAILDTKYYSSVIMVIKHENRYLKEWLDWHLSLGFDHIYLYDNGTEEKVIEWKIKERGGADPVYHKALKEFFYYNPDMVYLNNGENAVQAYE